MGREYRGRYCTVFYCEKVVDHRCCADCRLRKNGKCRNPCRNHPARCKLEDVSRRMERASEKEKS